MKHILITGASRGIGAAIAKALAANFARADKCIFHLVGNKSMEQLTALAGALRHDYGFLCNTYQCDVSKHKEVEALFDSLPRVDILVNNAGISHVGLLSDMSVKQWQKVIDTNLSSVFYTCRLAIPDMVKNQSGHIINISSVWGAAGASMEVAYSASKGAVNTLTRALAKELAPSGIQVNAVACGFIDTDMNNNLSCEEKQAVIDEIPANRMGTPEEVGQAVASILAMPSYYTGQILTLDGAWQ